MGKIKIKRGEQELEIEESEIQDGDERITGTQPPKDEEKKFTQADLNRLLADERRKNDKKYNDLNTQFTSYKEEVETERSKNEEKLKGKFDEAKKEYPESVQKLLDKMTVTEALEWIEENPAEDKQDLPRTPKEKKQGEKKLGLATIKF